MEIFQEQVQSPTRSDLQITIIRPVGDIDGSNFAQVIKSGEDAFTAGARNILVDLSGVSFMSSAGLVALHRMAVNLRKQLQDNHDDSWKSLEDMKKEAGTMTGTEEHIKLFNPQARVLRSLEQVGYDKIFQIFSNRDVALAAFR